MWLGLQRNLLAVCVGAASAAVLLWGLHRIERWASRRVAQRLGWRGVLATAWLGVPLHELGHLGAAWLFRHRLVDWRLFAPDPASGTLGYVRHAHRRRTWWQMTGYFFVGLAPLVTAHGALALLAWWMLPAGGVADLGQRLGALAHAGAAAQPDAAIRRAAALVYVTGAAVWRHADLWLPLQLYLGVCIVAHMVPSRADLARARTGALHAMIGLILLAGAASLAEIDLVGPTAAWLTLAAFSTAASAGVLGGYAGAVRWLTGRKQPGGMVLGASRTEAAAARGDSGAAARR